MKKFLIFLLTLPLFINLQPVKALAQEKITIETDIEVMKEINWEASQAAEVATSSANVEIEEVAKQDITERTSPVKGKLENYLAEEVPGQLRINNFLQHAIRRAVSQGVSANTIVLVLLFPLVAGLIAAGRHLLGLTGFGIFVPAILAVAFLATGIKVGIALFVIIWLVAALSRKIIGKLKLQYLPRLAILMDILKSS